MSQNATRLGVLTTSAGLIAAFVLDYNGQGYWVLAVMVALLAMWGIVFRKRLRSAAQSLSTLRRLYKELQRENEQLKREIERLRRAAASNAGGQGQSQQRRGADPFEAFFRGFGFSSARSPGAGGTTAEDLLDILLGLGMEFAGRRGFGGFGSAGANQGRSAPKRDFYDVLGVARNASPDDLKHAYRKRAMGCHPDRFPGDETKEAEFKELGEAYDVLKDPAKRTYYDRFGVPPQ